MLKRIVFNKIINKNEIKKIINWFINNFGSVKASKLIENLKETGFDFATDSGLSLGLEDLKIPTTKKELLKNTRKKVNNIKNKLKKGKINEIEFYKYTKEIWNQTNETLKEEILNNFKQTDLLSPIYIMMTSGARGNILQIKQLIGMRGLMVDPQGKIMNTPIKNNLKEGLDILEYFISCYGARKGIIDTAIKTANSGYLTRKLVYAIQDQIIKKPDCKTNNKHIILNKKNKKSYYKLTIEAITGRVTAKDITLEKIVIGKNQDICKYLAKKLIRLKKILIRSPLTCKLSKGICQLCYGWNIGNGRMVELGETIGIIAAQSIGEPGTQLTMRTFHTGGIFNTESSETVTAEQNSKIYYDTKHDGKLFKNRYKEKFFLTLNTKKIILLENKIKKSILILPKYSFIFVKNKKNIFKKQVIAEIYDKKKLHIKFNNKPKNLELTYIKSTISGEIKIKNEINSRNTNNHTWIINANILNTIKLNKNLKKEKKFQIKNKSNENNEAKNKISRSINNYKIKFHQRTQNKTENFNKKIKSFTKLYEIKYNIKKIFKLKNQITLNKIHTTKVIKINRKLKLGRFIPRNFKVNNNKKNKHSFQINEIRTNKLKIVKANLYLVSKNNILKIENKNIIKKDGIILSTKYDTEKVKDIVQGLPKIQELLESQKINYSSKNEKNISQKILEKNFKKLKYIYSEKIAARKSIYKIQKYLIEKIQSVYMSQGIKISNKHIEIIVKQMTSKAIIKNEGDSNLIVGEIIDINKIDTLNKTLTKKINYEPIIIGISKLNLTNNFISSACFQKTTTILTKAAIEGRIDWLQGIKENLVLGNLIPAGTGFKINKFSHYQNN